MKKTDDAVKIARYISEFLDVYAPNFLTSLDKGTQPFVVCDG